MAEPVAEEPRRSIDQSQLNVQNQNQPMLVETKAVLQPADSTVDTPPPMSKKAQKRLAKVQRYEAARPERLKRRKEQKIAKRQAHRAAIASGQITKPEPKESLPPIPSPLRVVIDCSFDELMVDREIKSICSQLTRCHAENKLARHPCTLYMTSWGTKIAERFTTVFHDQQNKWPRVHVCSEDYLQCRDLDKNDLVYLSADSDETIETIDESKVYIIGGLVDKNRYKGLCQEKADKQGIRTARLPIGQYIQMASRKVLTVNHVFEIMSRWLEMRDWEKAFLTVIPKRKLPNVVRDDQTDQNGEEGDDDDDDDDDEDGNTLDIEASGTTVDIPTVDQ